MFKKLFFLFFGTACMAILPAQAQQAKECFVNMPDSLSPLLTAVNRADFIDFLESNMKAEVTNRLEGKSQMTRLTSDYISVQMTPQSTWQMKLLSVNDTTRVVCTVSTVYAPAADSHIRFYTPDWKELPAASYLSSLPVMDDFILPAPDSVDVYEYEALRRQADLFLMQADLSPDSETLSFRFTTPDYMEKEAAKKLKPFLAPPLTYRWEEGRFRR